MSRTNSSNRSIIRATGLLVLAAVTLFIGMIALVISFTGPEVPAGVKYVDSPQVASINVRIQNIRITHPVPSENSMSIDFTILATSIPTTCHRTHVYLLDQEIAQLGPHVHVGSVIRFWMRTDRCELSFTPIPQAAVPIWYPGSDGISSWWLVISVGIFGTGLAILIVYLCFYGGHTVRSTTPAA